MAEKIERMELESESKDKVTFYQGYLWCFPPDFHLGTDSSFACWSSK